MNYSSDFNRFDTRKARHQRFLAMKKRKVAKNIDFQDVLRAVEDTNRILKKQRSS